MSNFNYRDNPPRMRVSIIGAGVSGLLIAYKLKKHLPEHVEFNIYEKSPDLGGTWYENKYPGCACDVPSHVYQYPFAPNPTWSKFYASSQEIQSYLKDVTQTFDLYQHIHFLSKVVSAVWSDATNIWTITLDNGTQIDSELLINAGGILNNPQIPDIMGLSSFAGQVLHTAIWDDRVSLVGKRVAVIGAGASAIQLLPQIQPLAEHVDVFIRTPSWITPPVGLENVDSKNHTYSDQEKRAFEAEPTEYLETRKNLEAYFNGMFRTFIKGSDEQHVLRQQLKLRMGELIADEKLRQKLIPTFEVGCRRINPGEAYLEALQQSNITPIFHAISHVTSNCVFSSNGNAHVVETIILATGFNTSFRPRFPIVGLNGVNLQDLWQKQPISYMGTGVSGFPNYLTFLGPNTPISNGSLMGTIEATGDYFIRIIRKMIRQNAKSFDVRAEAQFDFDKHTQAFMKDTVWTGTCRSWFKQGLDGRVTALWPGSSLHYMQTLAEDRWEDYHWDYRNGRFAYWGSGISWIEDNNIDKLGRAERQSQDSMSTIPRAESDLSYYLKESPPLHKNNNDNKSSIEKQKTSVLKSQTAQEELLISTSQSVIVPV